MISSGLWPLLKKYENGKRQAKKREREKKPWVHYLTAESTACGGGERANERGDRLKKRRVILKFKKWIDCAGDTGMLERYRKQSLLGRFGRFFLFIKN